MTQEPTITLEVDHVRRFVHTRWSGAFGATDIARNCQQRLKEGGHLYRQLVDAKAATIARSFEDMRAVSSTVSRLAQQSIKFGTAGATAVVVDNQIDFGMCRMIASYFEPAGEIQVFYRSEDAEKWLANVPERT